MKKIFIITFSSLVLLIGGGFAYLAYLNANKLPIEVTCDSSYNISANEMLLQCLVIDDNQIGTSDSLITMILLNEHDIIIDTHILEVGNNSFLFEELDFGAGYKMKVDGYYTYELELIEENYFDVEFRTVSEGFVLPTLDISVLDVSDLTAVLSMELVDISSSVISVEVIVMDDETEVAVFTIDDLDNLDLMLSELSQETEYRLHISALLEIVGCQVCSTETQIVDFTTLKTPSSPYARVNNVGHDNITLEFDLLYSDEDATDVIYLVELVDKDDNVLESFTPTHGEVSVDISSIQEDFTLYIKARYTFLEVNYSDKILTSYDVYTNQYANFFEVETLRLVDTSLPITRYEDYDDYLYTFYNAGETEFTINCSIFVDCTVLVDDPTYSDIVFDIEGFIHPFYAPRSISYTYSTELINITLGRGYTQTQMDQVNQKVEEVLNEIITEGMTEEEKILAVHDFVVLNTIYDTTCYDDFGACDNDHSAVGVLFDGNAVCEGYSHTVNILLRALRIPSFRISSSVHQWNSVLVDDEWYHLDSTWDDPVGDSHISFLSHDYYLIDTATLHDLDNTGWHDFLLKYLDFVE